MASKFLVLADYNAMGPSEVSLREGDLVELIKVRNYWDLQTSLS